MNTPISNPEVISRFKKERFLLSMSEDDFRDTVVRPLFLRQGLQDGRDLCGPSEKGKDAIFVSVDELGMENLYVIQTKKGSLTMSRRVGDNVIEAIDAATDKEVIRIELEHRGRQADFSQLYDEILQRSGLFRVVGERVEFRHHLLQEFFAGRGIPSEEMLKIVIPDQWWQRAIVFYFGENPDNSTAFADIIASLPARTPVEIYCSALTLGLALQACYLAKTSEKVNILPWIIETIAKSKNDFLKETDLKGKYPLTRFLDYYVISRDSLACDTLNLEYEAIRSALKKDGLSEDEKEIIEFWLISGLIECGELAKAQDAIARFKPRDVRLLLAIHLGCFLIEHLKVTSREEKKIASEISKSVGQEISYLREQLISEFKSELIELRQGQVKAIEWPKKEDADRPTDTK